MRGNDLTSSTLKGRSDRRLLAANVVAGSVTQGDPMSAHCAVTATHVGHPGLVLAPEFGDALAMQEHQEHTQRMGVPRGLRVSYLSYRGQRSSSLCWSEPVDLGPS
jgi:hypothetical protein